MNITLDKALLWLVPYLYFVSILYHWGFWGTFGIDAFSFYSVSDLLKGVTTFISTSIVFTSLVCIFVCIIMYTNDKFEYAFTLWALLVVLAIVGAFFLSYHLPSATPAAPSNSDEPFRWARVFFTLLSTLVAIAISELPDGGNLFKRVRGSKASRFKQARLHEHSPLLNSLRFSGILFFCLIPSQTYVDALVQANYVEQGKRYDYVVIEHTSDNLPKGIYKYLGKAGDYYILLARDNFKQIVMPVDKLVPLIVEHYEDASLKSKARLAVHDEQLKMPDSPLPTQLKQGLNTGPPRI
jgi:hypothetical protein